MVWPLLITLGSLNYPLCHVLGNITEPDVVWSQFPIPKKGNAKEHLNYYTIALISHVSIVMLNILQARLHRYMNWELPDVQTGFGKDRGTRDQIANIYCIIEKARELQKNVHFCFTDYAKAFDCVDHNKLWKILQEKVGITDYLTCLLRNLYAGQEATVRTGCETMDWFKLGKEYITAVYCHPAYLTFMQNTSCKLLGWMKHKLELRFPGEISTTSDTQMISLSSILATWCEELTHWKRPWCWERVKAGGEGDDRGWDSWMASPTQWTWVWVNSGSWWWTGRPGMLQSEGSQRVGHD